MRPAWKVIFPTLLGAATLAGCQIGIDATTTIQGSTSVPGGADPEDVAVIQEWTNALDAGDIGKAAELFALPSIAQNGITVRIETADEARAFNASLPCGAKLIRAVPHAGFTIATFRLTERPGPGECGDGTGGRAATAFEIRNGMITEWRRVPTPPVNRPPRIPGQVT